MSARCLQQTGINLGLNCVLALSLLFVPAWVLAQPAQPAPVDEASGLVIDEHWQLVKAHCTVCHSARQVTQQRGSRETWLSLIRWMQKTQGLWQFDAVTENSILDYLETNYAPVASYRRAPLPPELMPAPGNATESKSS
jgi:hypothetical protein